MKQQILVIGGGFAGISACQELVKNPSYDITLVDKNERFVFTPLLIDALAGLKHLHTISFSYESFCHRHGIRFVQAELESIDQHKRIVVLKQGTQTTVESYHELLLTYGAKTAYYGIPGATSYTLPIKSMEDIHRLHKTIHAHVQKALEASDTQTKRTYASFAIIGAGPAGIESAFAMKAYVKKLFGCDWDRIAPYTRFSIIQGSPTILPGFSSKAIALVTDELKKQGFDLYLGEPVERIDPHLIKTTKGTHIEASTILWCAGVEAQTIASLPPLVQERTGLLPDQSFRIAPHIYSAGDAIRCMLGSAAAPKTAQVAMPMGKAAAQLLVTHTTKPFHYLQKGSILTLGCTGIFDLPWITAKTALAPHVRSLLYRLRLWQLQR